MSDPTQPKQNNKNKLLLIFGFCIIVIIAIVGYRIIHKEKLVQVIDLGVPNAQALIPGCTWEQLISKKMGLGMWVQKCQETNMVPKLKFSARLPDQIIATSTRKGKKYENTIIRVFTKPADQPITEFIEQNFTKGLSEEAKDNCHVKVSEYNIPTNNNIERYELVPADAYIERKKQEADPDAGLTWAGLCGDFGLTNVNQYFEYHPGEDKSRLLFIYIGQDVPFFDKDSIKLFKPDLK